MEDDGIKNSVEVRQSSKAVAAVEAMAPPLTPVPLAQAALATTATPESLRYAHAGICNGRHSDCMAAGRAPGQSDGVRHHAQLRLNACEVDYQRLTSTVSHDNLDLQRHHRHIRRLMRETYGAL